MTFLRLSNPDGPRLRIIIAGASVEVLRAAARVRELKDMLHSPVWWIRCNAKARLPFAEMRERKFEHRRRQAKRRLDGMVI